MDSWLIFDVAITRLYWFITAFFLFSVSVKKNLFPENILIINHGQGSKNRLPFSF